MFRGTTHAVAFIGFTLVMAGIIVINVAEMINKFYSYVEILR